MKINKINPVNAIQNYRQQQDIHQEKKTSKKSMQRDEVQISPEAKELLNTKPTGREEKIESLKESVSNGTYHVDAGKIAEKLLPYFKK
ncbi:flagellar biosynthesis anti-sigma factor FlgM [Chengkuizengella axinellae]|uniref:Negative regulator of flagellin synthesis n=1 Tax=Chengkuizengella axinellae TaxID=3064388 RepID=A0ABT9J4H2_9BACL|nr:flagellar biosynthesis anti-sigma factor FlgM [Chengkuizengella sp. 2205SS18-9]MDP5275880.1 flagellar biosynthesis anti-sigma factor FlgM [Chengkuizengella sp. 2205SS18-9]